MNHPHLQNARFLAGLQIRQHRLLHLLRPDGVQVQDPIHWQWHRLAELILEWVGHGRELQFNTVLPIFYMGFARARNGPEERHFEAMSPARLTRDQRGLSLIVALVVTAGVGIVVGSILCLSSTRSTLTRRASQHHQSVAAAVAATQKVHARIARDFQQGGDVAINNNLANYRNLVPATAEVIAALQSVLGKAPAEAPWKDDQFIDLAGQINQNSVQKRTDWGFRELQTRLAGLRGYAADYTITSQSRRLNASYDILAAVKQDIQVASIPI